MPQNWQAVLPFVLVRHHGCDTCRSPIASRMVSGARIPPSHKLTKQRLSKALVKAFGPLRERQKMNKTENASLSARALRTVEVLTGHADTHAVEWAAPELRACHAARQPCGLEYKIAHSHSPIPLPLSPPFVLLWSRSNNKRAPPGLWRPRVGAQHNRFHMVTKLHQPALQLNNTAHHNTTHTQLTVKWHCGKIASH